MKKIIVTALGLALTAGSMNAHALVATPQNGTVSLIIGATCSIGGGFTGVFPQAPAGTYAAAAHTLGTFTVTCTAGSAYKLGIDGGTHLTGGAAGTRNMQSISLTNIPYTLSLANAGLTPALTATLVGDNDLGTLVGGGASGYTSAALINPAGITVNSAPAGASTFTVTGDIASQTVVAGSYTDTVKINVVY